VIIITNNAVWIFHPVGVLVLEENPPRKKTNGGDSRSCADNRLMLWSKCTMLVVCNDRLQDVCGADTTAELYEPTYGDTRGRGA